MSLLIRTWTREVTAHDGEIYQESILLCQGFYIYKIWETGSYQQTGRIYNELRVLAADEILDSADYTPVAFNGHHKYCIEMADLGYGKNYHD